MRSLLVIFGLIFSLAACADQTPAESVYQAGKHYVVLDQPVRTADPSKIEVAEVFAYTCGHCFTFEPLLQAWKKQQRDDVVVVQVPAIWNPQMEVYARGFEDMRRRVPDVGKLRRYTGFAPAVPLDEAIVRIVAYMRANER
jgi:thiol:disulfide interchange protein DsbA